MIHYVGDKDRIELPIFIDGVELPSNDASVVELLCHLADSTTGEIIGKWSSGVKTGYVQMEAVNNRFSFDFTVPDKPCLLEREIVFTFTDNAYLRNYTKTARSFFGSIKKKL